MDTNQFQQLIVYLPFLATIFLLFLVKRLYFYLRRFFRTFDLNKFRRILLYKTVTRRFPGSLNIPYFHLLNFTVIVALSIFALCFKNPTRKELAQRSASLSQLSLIVLCFGSYLSFLNEAILGFSLRALAPAHKWIGRLYISYLSVHVFLHLSLQGWSLLPSTPALLGFSTAFLLVMVPSLWIRRRCYEFVAITHSLMSYMYIAVLWFYLPLDNRYNLITLTIASSLIVFQKILQIATLYYRNRSFSAAANAASIRRYETIACLKITPRRPWKYTPGQYVYLRVPRVKNWTDIVFNRFQTHPYQIAWYSDEEGAQQVSKVYLIIQRRRGFSKWVNKASIIKIDPADELEMELYTKYIDPEIPGSSGNLSTKQYEIFPRVQIQGPYGGHQPERYEKLVLLSNGIGLASHLAVAKYLIEVGNRSLTRRIDLVWYSQSLEQSIIAKEYFRKLIALDSIYAKKLCIYFQDRFDVLKVDNLDGPKDYTNLKRIEESTEASALGALFKKCDNIEAGNTLIMVCGTPSFEQQVRTALPEWPKNEPYRLMYGDFQPDELRGDR